MADQPDGRRASSMGYGLNNIPKSLAAMMGLADG
jgi:hypothetical protein